MNRLCIHLSSFDQVKVFTCSLESTSGVPLASFRVEIGPNSIFFYFVSLFAPLLSTDISCLAGHRNSSWLEQNVMDQSDHIVWEKVEWALHGMSGQKGQSGEYTVIVPSNCNVTAYGMTRTMPVANLCIIMSRGAGKCYRHLLMQSFWILLPLSSV